jgi:hypothetical protein
VKYIKLFRPTIYLEQNVIIYFSSIGNKRSKKRLWHHKSQSIPHIFKTIVVLSVIPNPSPVVHKGCRPGGRPPISLITPRGLLIRHLLYTMYGLTNLPNINISHLKHCTKVPHDAFDECKISICMQPYAK